MTYFSGHMHFNIFIIQTEYTAKHKNLSEFESAEVMVQWQWCVEKTNFDILKFSLKQYSSVRGSGE